MRKRRAVKRDVLPDPIYNSKIVTKLINNIMLDGKKTVAQKIVYDAFDIVKEKQNKDALEVFEEAMEAVQAKVDKTVYEAKVAELQGQLTTFSEQAKYLGVWDCTAGLSLTNLPKDPYTYEEGSIFVVGKVAGKNEKVHTITELWGDVEKTVKFVVTDRDVKFTDLSELVQYLEEHGYTSRENSLPCTGKLLWQRLSV